MTRSLSNRSTATRALLAALICSAGCADAKGIEPVPPLDILQVLPASGSLEVGETATLGARRLRGGESANVTGTARWSSDDESVVTVSFDIENGAVVEAVGLGTARITAAEGGETATAEFIVRPSVVSLELDKGRFELAKGTSRPLGAAMIDSRGAKIAYDDAGSWGSSNPAIASVDDTGTITAAAAGEATITLTREGISTSQRVFVRDVRLESIAAVAVAGTTLPFGQSTPIRVTGTFSGGLTQDVSGLFTLALELPMVEPEPDASAEPEPILTLDETTVTAGPSAGMATLTGTGEGIADGETFSIELSVVDAPLTALSIELPAVLALGGDAAVASISGTYGEDLEFDTTATLSAEPAELVSIDNAAGTVAPLEPGSVEITASVMLEDGDDDPETGTTIRAMTTLEVVDATTPALALALASTEDLATIPIGGTTALAVTATFNGAEPVDVTDLVVFSSDDESIAVVSNVTSGKVTGVAAGMTAITARYRGATAELAMTVSP